jgi:hypothetical protein
MWYKTQVVVEAVVCLQKRGLNYVALTTRRCGHCSSDTASGFHFAALDPLEVEVRLNNILQESPCSRLDIFLNAFTTLLILLFLRFLRCKRAVKI